MTVRQAKGSVLLSAIIIVGLLVMATVLIGTVAYPITDRAYHPDEGVWTAVSKFAFQKFFIERDWRYETWADPRFGEFGTPNPPVGKYIVGASLVLNGVVDKETVFPGYEFPPGTTWLDVADEMPPQDALQAARAPMKWLGMFTAVLVFLLVRELSQSWQIGLGSGLFFVLQPLVIESSQRVMMDIPVLFFSLLTLLLAARVLPRLLKHPQLPVPGPAVAVGLAFGLAISTKLTGLLALVVIVSWVAAGIFLKKDGLAAGVTSPLVALKAALRRLLAFYRGVILSAVLFGFTAGLVFLLSNPFLYRHSVRNLIHIAKLGKRVSTYDVPPEQRLDNWEKRWDNLLKTGLDRSGVFRYWLGLEKVDGILAAAGGLLCLYHAFGKRQTETARRNFIWIGLWFALFTLGVLLWTPFNWQRWYVPLTPMWATLEGLAVVFLIQGSASVTRTVLNHFSRPAQLTQKG